MDRFRVVERALRKAAPHALVEAVQGALVAHYAAVSVDLLMADYAMTILQPVHALPCTADPVSVHASAPGRAFGAQQPHVERGQGADPVVVHLPVSVRGDRIGVLSVRLPVEAYDEDTAVELQEIAEILGHEIVVAERDTDLYLQARRADRLTLAAEMQWQLLPGRSCSRPEYDLGAQLEPAYAIYGDNFDWTTSASHLTLTVTNGMGEGIEAALLTNLAINALRNARRAGLSLADQACLADQAVYGHYRGAVHLSMLLLRFDLATGEAEVIDAGSPKMWRVRHGRPEAVELDAQLPLGMFEDTLYTVQHFRVEPADRLLFISDGVYDVASPAGERYSERALTRAITSTRLLPPSQVPRAVLHELAGHRGAIDADDDAMIVCLDWHGRP
ncbi:serine/threonine-protein phosphatase [Streptomyces alfalfae]|uniref:Phosphatase n=1 Tax=Streptomyces alfalfae TaxID=1642299 RepID=A0ABM6H047_9ACTN|nr:PP2C family protein-serine/threonine phosphatase [Streptomyces alfalfae]AYA19940.1 serine/threonine-protein phosphatase [Streptomyces fradiae]APY89501.1 phosphatase [Streptomyces alfalfae]QUI30463.1 serine/threonine-protein phosphatase [Streptomyces alfalfae]RXX44203.1 serine/threonine-protein phosphatase [Streptomyces alfalfae]RZN02135.1 serine/threonine-protein phosphatase [Streptomyces alfalfae]